MSKEISLKQIRALILKNSNRNDGTEIPAGSNLFDDGFLDSFSVMQLVQSLEAEYEIVFDYSDLRREYFASVEAISGLLTKKYGINKAD